MRPSTFALIIGPTAVGKSTVLAAVLERLPRAVHVLSTTCRAPRAHELDGRDFHFLSCDDFQKRAAEGDFFEYAQYSEHWYGTSRSGLERVMAAHPLAIKIVEIQGARIIKQKMPEAVTIFIKPGRFEDLEPRLRRRNPPMKEADILKRLATAPGEIAAASECDYVVTNWEGRLPETILETVRILEACRSR